jgi:signal transduction histidine kinase
MFHSARMSLTIWYVLILTIITTLFSIGLYRVSSIEIDRIAKINQQRMQRWIELGLPIPEERRLKNLLPFQDPELIEETKKRIAQQLILIDAVILALAGVGSYLLAGKTLKPIEEMLTDQKQFISDASHELKTPLTALKTSFEVYLRNTKRTRKDADTIMSESIEDVDRMTTLTDHLLTHAILEQKQFTASQKVALHEIVENAIKTTTPLAQKKELAIELHNKTAYVIGDETMLTRMCVALLDNAIKYTPEKKQIIISITNEKKCVKLSLTDQGIGISKSSLPHIFDRFYRADQSRTKKEVTGFGLGLSIVKQIVDAHHGQIHVQSTQNKGSTFTVRLPRTDTV